MKESMMIAEVGDIEKVSGSRMATPLAPPRPGSTPMITPSRMPVNIRTRLNGSRTTAKPWNSEATSAKSHSSPDVFVFGIRAGVGTGRGPSAPEVVPPVRQRVTTLYWGALHRVWYLVYIIPDTVDRKSTRLNSSH